MQVQIDVDDDNNNMSFLESKQVALDDVDQDNDDKAHDASQADNEKAGDHEGKDMHIKDDDITSTSSNSRNDYLATFLQGGVNQGGRVIDNGNNDVAENSNPNIDQENQPTISSIPMDPKHLSIRNLPFSATEEAIATHFEGTLKNSAIKSNGNVELSLRTWI